MTIFVTEPNTRGKMTKPEPVVQRYASGDNLHWLVARHPDSIYYTDDTTEWDEAPVTETRVEFKIFAYDMEVSPAYSTSEQAHLDFSTRSFAPGKAEIRTRTVTVTTTPWKTEESK